MRRYAAAAVRHTAMAASAQFGRSVNVSKPAEVHRASRS